MTKTRRALGSGQMVVPLNTQIGILDNQTVTMEMVKIVHNNFMGIGLMCLAQIGQRGSCAARKYAHQNLKPPYHHILEPHQQMLDLSEAINYDILFATFHFKYVQFLIGKFK